MAGQQGIKAGRAYIEIGVNDKFTKGLKMMSAKLKAFGTQVAGVGLKLMALGGAVLGPMALATRSFAKAGDALGKMSKRTGVSVEALSQLEFAASQSGVEMGTLEKGIKTMQRSIYDAGRGLATQTDALKDLGLTFDDLKDLSPEAQFKLIADRLAQTENPTKKAAISMMLFGRAGQAMIPMLNQGADGIAALMEEADALGLTMSTEDAQAAEEFTDALDKLVRTVKMAVFHIGSALAPAIQEFINWVRPLVKTVMEWIQNNRGLIETILKVTAVVVGVGIALTVAGGVISGFGTVLGIVAKGFGLVSMAIKGVIALLPMLLSPLGLIAAGAVAMTTVWLKSSGNMGKLTGWLGERFDQLKEEATTAMGLIGQAIAQGDIGSAAEVLWAFLKLQWQKGVAGVKKIWSTVKKHFLQVAYSAFYGGWFIARKIWGYLEIGWIEVSNFFAKAWHKVVAFFLISWEKMKKYAKKAWVFIKALWQDEDETAAQYAQIDQEFERRVAEIDADADKKVVAREAMREEQRKKQREDEEATVTKIRDRWMKAMDDTDAAHEKRMAEAGDDYEKAMTAWEDKTAEVADRLGQKTAGGEADLPELDDMTGGMDELADAAWGAAEDLEKGLTAGGFAAETAAQAVGGTAAERTAAATERTAKAVESQLTETREGAAY